MISYALTAAGYLKFLAILGWYVLVAGYRPDSKTGVGETPPWVQIPPSPPFFQQLTGENLLTFATFLCRVARRWRGQNLSTRTTRFSLPTLIRFPSSRLSTASLSLTGTPCA
jgi:hypothetical protein